MEAPTTVTTAQPVQDASQAVSAVGLLASSLRQALTYWPVLGLFWLGSFLTAALVSLVPSALLYRLADQPVIREIANGVDAWQVIDLLGFVQAQNSAEAGSPSDLTGGVLSLVLGWLALPLVGGVVSAFLYGGALLIYREAPAPFRWGRFLAGGWRWFGAFLGLALVQFFLFQLAFLPFALILLQFGRLGDWGYGIALALIVLAGVLWTMLFELARVQTVRLDTRNPFRGLAAGFRLMAQRPGLVFGFYALALLLLGLVHAVFRLGILPLIPLEAFPLAFIAQQVFVTLRLYLRAVRLAGAAAVPPKMERIDRVEEISTVE